jgi:hypothetical protein
MRRIHHRPAINHRRAFPLAVVAIATVAAAACGSSASKPPAQATQPAPPHPAVAQAVTTTPPAAPPQKFISLRYSFRVTLTKGWSENDARVAWNGRKLQGLQSPAFANFTDLDPATDRALATAAARVAKGMRLAEWRAAMVRAASAACSESSSVERTTLAGEPALAWTAMCSDGYHVHKLAALHARRGYMMLLASPIANNDAKDRRIFESIRRSFRFTRQ